MTDLVMIKQTAAASIDVLVDLSYRDDATGKRQPFPAAFVSNGLVGVEVVDILISDDGVNYAPLLNHQTGSPEQLTATSNTFIIAHPANLRFNKSITTALVGIGVSAANAA